MKSDEYSSFVRVLFGLTTPSPVSADLVDGKDLEWIDPSLNESQKDAIRFALASKEVALIHGPPGVCALFLPFPKVELQASFIDDITDWKDSYIDRANFTDAQAEFKSSCLRTIQYLS